MQYGFYFDQTRCIGCYTCIVSCKDSHNVEAGPASWTSLATIVLNLLVYLLVPLELLRRETRMG